MDDIIKMLIDEFNIVDTIDEEVGSKTKEENAQDFLDKILLNSVKIKENYNFTSKDQFLDLIKGAALEDFIGVTYWDYIESDTLLSLQKPKTNYPDEIIFITYHQQCELYFKLIIQELERIFDFYEEDFEKKNFKLKDSNIYLDELKTWEERLTRVIRYWRNLIISFDILKKGFSSEEFREFRKALLPASGFQTYQFRKMEIMLTDLKNLTIPSSEDVKKLYWRQGAINQSDNKPSKLLENFNNKYDSIFFELVERFKGKTIFNLFQDKLSDKDRKQIKPLLIDLEDTILLWKIAHMNMIVEHIPKNSSGTGGTDYSKYLPQLKQLEGKEVVFNKGSQVLYFPEFWTGRNHENYISSKVAELPTQMNEMIYSIFPPNNAFGFENSEE